MTSETESPDEGDISEADDAASPTSDAAASADGATADVTDAEILEDLDFDAETAVPLEISEEAVVALIAERDEYLDALQRLKAEFANARRRSDEGAAAQRAQAAAGLVEKLLPVLDSCEAALAQGIDEIRPVSTALFDILAGQGLERLDAVGEAFDPELHEAVLYEEGEGEQVVIEILRSGYRWNSRVIRPPMVKVKG